MQDVYLGHRPNFVSTTLFSCNNNEYREISKAKFDKSNYYSPRQIPTDSFLFRGTKNHEFIKYAHTL